MVDFGEKCLTLQHPLLLLCKAIGSAVRVAFVKTSSMLTVSQQWQPSSSARHQEPERNTPPASEIVNTLAEDAHLCSRHFRNLYFDCMGTPKSVYVFTHNIHTYIHTKLHT